MNKTQFWLLNFVGGLCALLIVTNLVLMRRNEASGQTLMGRQNEVSQAQQIRNTMQNLVMRIAQGAQSEPALSNLLMRQDLRINVPQANQQNLNSVKPQETPAQPAP